MTRVSIALGSNLGDRHAHLSWATDRLKRFISNLQVSSFFDTEPVDVPEPQPDYLNAVVVGETALEPRELMAELAAIERERGRERAAYHEARTLDLDLLLYGDAIIDLPDLVVPHPSFRERRFVLEPFAEIAWDWRDPVTGLTVGKLLAALDAKEK